MDYDINPRMLAMQNDPFPHRVTFMATRAHHCRWPIEGTSGAYMLCCGARRAPGRPYCPAHVEESISRVTAPAPRPVREATMERHRRVREGAETEADLTVLFGEDE